jgi:hypothetical protein
MQSVVMCTVLVVGFLLDIYLEVSSVKPKYHWLTGFITGCAVVASYFLLEQP